MTAHRAFALAALILAILSMFVPAYPLLVLSVICLAIAALL